MFKDWVNGPIYTAYQFMVLQLRFRSRCILDTYSRSLLTQFAFSILESMCTVAHSFQAQELESFLTCAYHTSIPASGDTLLIQSGLGTNVSCHTCTDNLKYSVREVSSFVLWFSMIRIYQETLSIFLNKVLAFLLQHIALECSRCIVKAKFPNNFLENDLKMVVSISFSFPLQKLEVVIPDTSRLPTLKDDKFMLEFYNAVPAKQMIELYAR